LSQAWYYWQKCGAYPMHPVTAEYRPTTNTRTIGALYDMRYLVYIT